MDLKQIKRTSKNKYNSPIKFPKLYLSCNSRSRLSSESSNDSEDSFCIKFQDHSQCNSKSETLNSDYKSSSDEEFSVEESGDEKSNDEESDNEQTNERLNLKVCFAPEPKIYTMVQWNFAYRAARRGPWEQLAQNRTRFYDRINSVSEILKPILTLQHREHVYQSRFNVNYQLF